MEEIFQKTKTIFGKRLDNESKTLFKNSSWIFFSNFVGIGLGFLRSVVIARGLGAEIFGTYAIVVAFVGIVQEFLNLNLGTAIIKFGAAYHNEQRIDKLTALIKLSLKASGIMILVSIVVVTLLSLISYSTFINKPGLELFIIFYAVAASTKYFNSISNGILRLYFKFRLNSVIQIIMDVVETILIILAILFFRSNLEVFFITIIITRFLNGVICNWMAFWELRKEILPFIKVKADLIKDEIKDVRSFVIGNSLGNSLKSLMAQGDVLLLGALAGPVQVAFYAVAKRLGYAILALTDPLMQSIFPQFSKLVAEKKYHEIKKMLRKVTLAAIIPAVVLILVVYFFKEWIVVTVYGKKYMDAVNPFLWLLAGAVMGSITFWTLPLIQSLGLVKFRLKIYSIAIVTGALIATLLIPSRAAAGMAIALLCANLIINSSFVYKAYERIRLSEKIILS